MENVNTWKQNVWEDNRHQGHWALSAWNEESQSQEWLSVITRGEHTRSYIRNLQVISLVQSIRVRRVIESESE